MKGVSIPHRFNSHPLFQRECFMVMIVSIPHRFNSHTSKTCDNLSNSTLFQSLTGSIHTHLLFKFLRTWFTVSIPHRFNSHWFILYRIGIKFKVSIPHRFNSHRENTSKRKFLQSSFNPSQVQFTPLLFLPLDNLCLVSIPHRFNSHKVLSLILLIAYISFNPSQVQFTQNGG